MFSVQKLVVIFFLISATICEETYENSTNICERCECIPGPQFVLDCKNQNFHHMISDWPQHNTSLIATFSNNNITNLEIIPDSDLVTQLIFNHCGIKSLDNGVFKAVKNVKFVDLSYNLLTTEEIAPEKFKGPYNNTVYEPLSITHLDLSYNQIHSLPHNIFEHLISLEELNLEGNQLRVLDPPTQMAISSLTNLEVLNLANNYLTELIDDAVRTLQNLKVLNLARNRLDFVPENLALLSESLESVYLDYNIIFELTDESFLGVKGIKHLYLTNLPRLQFVTANTFAPLKHLKILYLSDNKNLTGIDRDAFGPNQTLEELYIHNNSLRVLHHDLTKWSTLKIFTLSHNDLPCDCDLYNISQDLSWDVKRDRDGPLCINPLTDRSTMIYSLTEDVCRLKKYNRTAIQMVDHHFRKIRTVLLITSTLLIFITAAVGIIVILKFRRYRMNQSYPFAAQVMYNPLRNPFNP